MRQPTPKSIVRNLEARIDRFAKLRGIPPDRARKLISFMAICGCLSNAVAKGVIQMYLVKGGVAMEARFGLRARATKDIDIGLMSASQDLLLSLESALAVGYAEYQFRNKSSRELENGIVRAEVSILYLGQPWATVDVDLNTASHDATTEDLDAIDFSELGLPLPSQIVCLGALEQIAQKIHALTEPLPEGRRNERVHDVLDVLLIDSHEKPDYSRLRSLCEREFEKRAIHAWPPAGFKFSDHWKRPIETLARENGFPLTDASALEVEFSSLIARILGVNTMPGYDYQFLVLTAHQAPPNVATHAFETNNPAYETLVRFTEKENYRIAHIMEYPGRDKTRAVLVVLERPRESSAD